MNLQYYHLVTRKPMHVGQKIVFDKTHKNRLYSFFLDNNFKNKTNETVDQIIHRLDSSIDDVELSF